MINLHARNPQYRRGWDPAARGNREPAMQLLLCRYGVIYAHGPGRLAVEPDGHPAIARRLRDLGLTVHQDGDAEWTFLFPVEAFEDVARIVRPYRRRVNRPGARARSRQRLAKAHASPGHSDPGTHDLPRGRVNARSRVDRPSKGRFARRAARG
jgi:hypothetical protein